jgi:hypothetical protein
VAGHFGRVRDVNKGMKEQSTRTVNNSFFHKEFWKGKIRPDGRNPTQPKSLKYTT